MERLPFLLCLLMAAASLTAQPIAPILTLNTEMHTAPINRISTDSRGRYLLTCSNDKTAKLWDIRTGNLIHTFRIPIGNEREGRLDACAITPNGKLVALGGWTGKKGTNKSIYIFDVQTGQLNFTISDLPNVVYDLEYSPDGRYLAASLFGKNGIRVFETEGYSLKLKDTDYGGDCSSICFDAWGRLATVSLDGNIRLYGANFILQKIIAPVSASVPYSVCFSPDSRLLAIGYTTHVDVFDANSMELKFQPKMDGIKSDYRVFKSIVFSFDGSQLAAGGYYKAKKGDNWWNQFRIWNLENQSYQDYDSGSNTVMDIKPLPSGDFVFASYHPDWGIISPNTGKSIYKIAETYQYGSDYDSHFHLGNGGLEVGIRPYWHLPITFSLSTRKISFETSKYPSPISTQNGLKITEFNASYNPKLNDQILFILEKGERTFSVDIATGGKGIIFGTEWNIRCTDANGKMQWSQPTQGAVRCIKVDAYNQVVASAQGDGTIRWYRFRDGQPLLSLYLHPDGERWVLWTPGGYYDCSPGAESLIGWHVNNGSDKEASYYPISRFRDTYYRPDVIDLILETFDENMALQDANVKNNRRSTTLSITEQLPPTVRIHSPSNETEVGQTTVSITYSIESPNGEDITGLRIMVDGRPVATERGLKPISKRLEAQVVIPAGDCTVSVIAENRFGASEAANVRLRWKGAVQKESEGVDIRPTLYVLAVGVSKYQHDDILDLDFASKDAADFVTALKKQEGGLYKKVVFKLLNGPNAKRDSIINGMQWLKQQTTQNDIAMLFFAGHGMDDNSQDVYLMPINADPDFMPSTCITKADVQRVASNVPGKMIVFLDACQMGKVMGTYKRRNGVPPDIMLLVNELASAENGSIIFSATTNRQDALEDPTWKNGAFTKAIIEGFQGQARHDGSNRITWQSLGVHVAERVRDLTKGQQTPVTVNVDFIPDFPIGIVR